jgi:ubiquinone/menaquinone biosynthesis C-methylase UbiE
VKNIILHPNATPVYGFLSLIQSKLPQGTSFQGKNILDCGAGGPIPPLALFQQHGFEAWGIDSSESQLDKAKVFCQQNAIDLHLQMGDMRCIPYENESFDFVYEHFSMCHLSKRDTAIAIGEMRRVLKPNGLCFLGFISTDCWPRSLFGDERNRGEYWGEEDGRSDVLHSMVTDQEANELVSEWEVVSQEKQVRYLREVASQTSLDSWMGMRKETGKGFSQSAWRRKYPNRMDDFRYVHLYFCLKK